MHRVDGPGHDNNMFTEGVEGVTPATTITADILNAVQEEIVGVINGAAISLNKADNGQLTTALNSLISAAINAQDIQSLVDAAIVTAGWDDVTNIDVSQFKDFYYWNYYASQTG